MTQARDTIRKIAAIVTTVARRLADPTRGATVPARRSAAPRRCPIHTPITNRLLAVADLLFRSSHIGSLALLLVATQALATDPPEAVGSLYLTGTGQYLCTASVVDGPELGLEHPLVVLTAAHCVEPYLRRDGDSGRWVNHQEYRVGFDGETFYDVVPMRVGFADAGYDLAVLRFVTAAPELSPMRMGSWDRIDFGTFIHNYANPLGLGIQYFRGSVTMLRIEPSPSNAQPRWFYNAVAALQVGPGSSGSLILTGTLEYVGVLSGVVEARFGSPFTVFVPQWKIVEFLNYQEAGRDVGCGECLHSLSAGVLPDHMASLTQ